MLGQLDTSWSAPYTPSLARQSSSCKLVAVNTIKQRISTEETIGELDAQS